MLTNTPDFAKPLFHGLTGAHGCGKSTMLSALRTHVADHNLNILVPDLPSIPRQAQADLGKSSLEEANGRATFMQLQDRIIDITRTRLDQLTYDHSSSVNSISGLAKPKQIFLDRTPVDYVAYAMLWIEKNFGSYHAAPTDVQAWMAMYRTKCLVLSRYFSTIVHVYPDSAIPFVAEAQRGAPEDIFAFVGHADEFAACLYAPTHVVYYANRVNSDLITERTRYLLSIANMHPTTYPRSVHNKPVARSGKLGYYAPYPEA